MGAERVGKGCLCRRAYKVSLRPRAPNGPHPGAMTEPQTPRPARSSTHVPGWIKVVGIVLLVLAAAWILGFIVNTIARVTGITA